jgi:hypothetical protein
MSIEQIETVFRKGGLLAFQSVIFTAIAIAQSASNKHGLVR